MADLSAMYMDLAENIRNAPFQGASRMQQLMENQLAYQKAKEDMEAQRGLRALFQQNPNATPEEASRYSPQFGMEMVKAQQEAQERSGRMTKTQREISEMEAKTVAETLAPIAERAKMTGDLNTYKVEMGKAASYLASQGIPLPANFDPEQHTPDAVLMNAYARGYKSPLIENEAALQREQMLSQVPPRMSATQAYGDVEMGSYGPRLKPPLPQSGRMPKGTGMGGAPAAQLPEGYQRATAEDIPLLEQAYAQATDVNEKQQIGALLNQLKQQTQAPDMGGGFVTPEQERAFESEKKTEESRLATEKELNVAKGKQVLEEQAASKKATVAYDMLPEPDRIRNLIKGSISGDVDYWTNRLGGVVGKSLEAGDITGALKVIEGQMADTVAMFPGAQSDKELEARMKTIGNPSGEISADTRLRAFDEWLQRMQKYAAKHADYDDTTLLDMVKSQKLTADQARQIRQRRMSGGQ